MESEPPLSEYYLSFSLLFLLQLQWGFTLSIIFLIILLICSAAISGSEVAFFSLSSTDIKNLEEENTPPGKRLVYLRNHPRKLLATILIANNLINIAIVIVSAAVLAKLLPESKFISWGEWLYSLGIFNWTNVQFIAIGISFIITVIGVTFLLVLFGEVAPKIYAKVNNIGMAKTMAMPLTILLSLFSPVSSQLVRWSNRMERRLAKNNPSNPTNKGDIDMAIDLTVSQRTASPEEAEILKGIIKFNDVAVKQIMRSRVDIVAVDTETKFTELLRIILESGYSRIPVFKEDFDSIIGILYVKDLMTHLDQGDGFDWQPLVRPSLIYVPESKKINELLKEFQKERMHMAIVVDEYGGSAGIVTLEDVMEEVIGEIKDEFDEEQEVEYTKLDDHTFIFEGKSLLNDVCRIIGVDITRFDTIKGDSDSIAGLVVNLSGEIPEKGIRLEYEEFTFVIQAVTKRRVSKVKLLIKE